MAAAKWHRAAQGRRTRVVEICEPAPAQAENPRRRPGGVAATLTAAPPAEGCASKIALGTTPPTTKGHCRVRALFARGTETVSRHMGQLLALCGAIPQGAIRERKGQLLWATSGRYNRLCTTPGSAAQPQTSQVAGHGAALFLPAFTTSRQDLQGS